MKNREESVPILFKKASGDQPDVTKLSEAVTKDQEKVVSEALEYLKNSDNIAWDVFFLLSCFFVL